MIEDAVVESVKLNAACGLHPYRALGASETTSAACFEAYSAHAMLAMHLELAMHARSSEMAHFQPRPTIGHIESVVRMEWGANAEEILNDVLADLRIENMRMRTASCMYPDKYSRAPFIPRDAWEDANDAIKAREALLAEESMI